MTNTTADSTQAPARRHPLWMKLLIGFVVVLAAVALLIAFFPWDVLRGPVNRYVTAKTGRHFEITRRLDVKLGRNTRVIADGLEFANPDWAADRYLVKAEGAEVQVELWPLLLHRQIELPRIELRKPQLGLQIEPDGRRTWALTTTNATPHNVPHFGEVVVDDGTAHFLARGHGADVQAQFAMDSSTDARQQIAQAAVAAASSPAAPARTQQAQMPLTFTAQGTWKNEPFRAKGRTGNVVTLSKTALQPFPVDITAEASSASLRAQGALGSIATLNGIDVQFNLQGKDLSTLYKVIGVVLPATPHYSLRGHLVKDDLVWHARELTGKLGESDLSGDLDFDRAGNVPHLSGKVHSNTLDFNDLAPLVGLPEQSGRSDKPAPVDANGKKVKVKRDPAHKVLPTAQLDVARLKAMTADVSYTAARITHPQQLPLDRISVDVKLRDGVLRLDPLKLGVAGGTLAGAILINGNSTPAIAEAHLDLRAMELNKLFPGVKITQASFGKIHGDIDLKGRGNSVAQMLGTSSGNVALLMGHGELSNLLLEFAGLDGGEIIKFLVTGDRNVTLRCAAAAFDVKNGLMASRALLLDTSDTIMYGDGVLSLANESMDLTLRPYPKDKSVLSFRSPLKVTGTFSSPKAGVDKAGLAMKAGSVLALGAINPLLALAGTIETGPGKDANCGEVLRDAASTDRQASVAIMQQENSQKGSSILGGSDSGKPSLLKRLFGPKQRKPGDPS